MSLESSLALSIKSCLDPTLPPLASRQPSQCEHIFLNINSFLEKREAHAIGLTKKHLVLPINDNWQLAQAQGKKREIRELTSLIEKSISEDIDIVNKVLDDLKRLNLLPANEPLDAVKKKILAQHNANIDKRMRLLDQLAQSNNLEILDQIFDVITVEELEKFINFFLHSKEFPIWHHQIMTILKDHLENEITKSLEEYLGIRSLDSDEATIVNTAIHILEGCAGTLHLLKLLGNENLIRKYSEKITHFLIETADGYCEKNEIDKAIAIAHLIPIEEDRDFVLQCIAARFPS